MKPIMRAAFAVLAFALLPSEVLAQDEGAAAEAEAAAAEAEAAAVSAEAAAEAGDVKAAAAAYKEAQEAHFSAGVAYDNSLDMLNARVSDPRVKVAYERAGEALARAMAANRRADVVAGEREINEAPERAREAAAAAERAVEDYRVIYGILESAELAVALAERALENAESEENYAEAWKRHREAEQYRDSLSAIAIRAESLAVSARERANWAAENVDIEPYRIAGWAREAAENANEIANLRAQVEG